MFWLMCAWNEEVNSQTILKRMTRMLSHLNPVNSLKVGRTFRETHDWFFFVSLLAFIAINAVLFTGRSTWTNCSVIRKSATGRRSFPITLDCGKGPGCAAGPDNFYEMSSTLAGELRGFSERDLFGERGLIGGPTSEDPPQ
jgi:hypothetical protein